MTFQNDPFRDADALFNDPGFRIDAVSLFHNAIPVQFQFLVIISIPGV